MRQMKDSGIEWIGKIPENWGIERGKNIITKLERPVLEDDGVITCFRDGEVTLRSKRREEGFTVSLQETGYQGIEKGDLVVHGMDGFAGSIGISDSRGKATPVLNVLDSNEDKKYLMYYMRSAAFCGLFLSLATGIRIRTCDTNWNKLKNVLYLVPPLPEQQKISTYLDRQCRLIDSVIEKTKASIEEYKKLRQAVITQAVTKGVCGDRPMKDSGIEWIGEIPQEWKVLKTIYLFKENVRTPDENAISLSLSQTDGLIPTDEMKESSLKTSTYEGWKQVRLGDLVLNRFKGHLGVLYAAWIEGMVSFHYGVYEPQTELDTKYYEYLYHSDCYRAILGLKSNGMTIGLQNLSNQNFYSVMSLYPPYDEQKELVEYLDKKCAEIDSLITKKETFLTELEAYKKSMIYEYVTGKKEVPQA